MDAVLLFSIRTSLGIFEVRTPGETFNITGETFGSTYTLHIDSDPEFMSEYTSPYKAIVATANHQTGYSQWDDSSEKVSDYAADWNRHIDKKFKMRLLGNYLELNPDSSYRKLIDYFEHKRSYALERSEIAELLEELIVTAQLDKPLNDWMVPAELRRVASFANRCLRNGGA